MAFVKKLQTGGTIDNDALNKELSKQLESSNLRGKDQKKVQDALVQFRDYLGAGGDKSFSVDELTHKYTVKGQGSEALAGATGDVESN